MTRKEYKRKQYLNSRQAKSIEKLCDYCNNPFFAFGNTKYCSTRCSALSQWSKRESHKERKSSKQEWRERWDYFWKKYYRLSKKDRHEYFEEFKKTIGPVYIEETPRQTSKIDHSSGVSSKHDKVAV